MTIDESRPSQTLYRMKSASDELLYVGITSQRVNRFDQHAATKKWWPEVSRIEIEHHPDRATVLAAEKRAIKAECPRYNIVHNDGRGEAGGKRKRAGLRYWDEAPSRAPIADVYSKYGKHMECPVWLEYEVNGSSVFGEFHPEEREEAWEHYLDTFITEPFIPIYWSFAPLWETATRAQSVRGDGEAVLDFYDIQLYGHKLTEETMQILPVAPSGNSSMGFKPLSWRPAPLQEYVSRDVILATYWASKEASA